MRPEYRGITGYPGYRVGNDGTVWSCRQRKRLSGSRGGTYAVITNHWKLLKPNPDSHGRQRISLYPGGKPFLIHRLVLQEFIGPCPQGMQACHFPDRDPTNNRLNNLRWGTPKENYLDGVMHGTMGRGSKCGRRAKLTPENLKKAKITYASGARMQDLAEFYGIGLTTMWNAIHGKTKYKNWK